MAFSLRIAATSDAADVGRVTVQAYAQDGLLGLEDDYAGVLGDAVGRIEDAEVWVAEDERGILGSVTFCRPGTPYSELSRGKEGEFRMLGVAHRARRQGVAAALVTRCIDRSRELGYTALVLCSMEEMGSAHRLYERLGFRRLPERDWSPVPDMLLLAFIRSVD